MKKPTNGFLQFSFLIFFSILSTASADADKQFVSCFVRNSKPPINISTPGSPSYESTLHFYSKNLRFTYPNTRKPAAIITPETESHIQTAIYCSKKHHLQMRMLSGGHDFEGRSYVADVPFFILNMFNFRSISIDAKSQTAWVGPAATLGETYYSIHQTNSSLAFPAGYCPTVCIGGHVSGGGYGALVRKFGIAADHVIDARLIDANGRILDRESMGEDLFWAIRGGTGASFGIILAYKIQLVEVRKTFTAFILTRTLEQNATKLVHKWQYVAPKLPADLIIPLQLTVVKSNQTGKSTVAATFVSAFQGGVEELLDIMQEKFPELGLVKEDCTELSWVEYLFFHFGLPIESTNDFLLGKITAIPVDYYKSKSDFFQHPIPEEGLEEIWKTLLMKMDSRLEWFMEWTPLGARMDEIPESEIPFPHRAGNLFLALEQIQWNSTSVELMQEALARMRALHAVLGRYASKNPRSAYANYKDLDLGVNNVGKTSVEKARIWGAPYFKNNFNRLVEVKTSADPDDFFKNEQSIPPLSTHISSTVSAY